MNSLANRERQKYRPDVNRYLALCSRNYGHLLRWLPEDADTGQRWQMHAGFGTLGIQVLENTKYTQLVEIYRPVGDSEFVNQPRVVVRIYHDAKLAEVLTGQQIFQLRPVYDYPNLRMYHRDEKYQANAFLEELLKLDGRVCLAAQS